MPKDTQGHGPELGSFEWSDPMLLERQLTEDERMLRDAARQFAEEVLQPRVAEGYATEKADPLNAANSRSNVLGVMCRRVAMWLRKSGISTSKASMMRSP